jgi:hypothetical protein
MIHAVQWLIDHLDRTGSHKEAGYPASDDAAVSGC